MSVIREGSKYLAGNFDDMLNDAMLGGVDPCTLPAGTLITAGIGTSLVLPSLDFETFSEAGYYIDEAGKVRGKGSQGKGGLPVVGTPAYALHPSTEILCLYYDLKDGRGRRSWIPGGPDPTDLLQYVASGGPLEAWNITFEYWIWNAIGARRHGWPALRLEQCHCAMAKARRNSLPGALGNACKVLGTPLKDKEGTRLIQKLTRPHTPTKKRAEFRWLPTTAPEDYGSLYGYCDRDVETEDHASAHIPDLTPYERATWLTDQTINLRGVQVDVEALDAMLDILAQAEQKYSAELATITGGRAKAASELPAMKAWLEETQGVSMPDMTKDTITEALAEWQLPPDARRVLEIRELLGAANIKKLHKLKLQINGDGRLRNQYMYCGADRTGRWSSAAADDGATNSQLQNITAKGPTSCECDACGEYFHEAHDGNCPHCGSFLWRPCLDWTVEAVEAALRVIATRSLQAVELFWGDPIAVLCGCLRGLFTARDGHDLVCCDFSAIEAVVLACLSRCQWRIDVFNTHGKIYEMGAAKISGVPFEEIIEYQERTGQNHKLRKTIGKVSELAGGYGGWINAWQQFGAGDFMNEDEIKEAILAWRAASPEIVEFWGGQFKWCGPGKWDYRAELHGLEGAAIQAIRNPGKCFSYIDITYGVWDDVLHCRLPSGRFLKYHRPRLHDVEDKLRRGPAVGITFEGYNSNSQKGPIGWHRLETYGGRLAENCIAEGTPVLTGRGWIPIESVRRTDVVHDGVEFVSHGGRLFKSTQSCVTVEGVYMTPDHEVLTHDGWQAASQDPRPFRPALRNADRATTWRKRWQKTQVVVSLRLRPAVRESVLLRRQGGKVWAHAELRVHGGGVHRPRTSNARHEQAPRLRGVALDDRSLQAADAPSVGQLRRPRHSRLRRVAHRLLCILGRYGADVQARTAARSTGQRRRVLGQQLPVGTGESQLEQQAHERPRADASRRDDRRGGVGPVGDQRHDAVIPDRAPLADSTFIRGAGLSEPRRVWDIVNAGPRQRFVVRGVNGPFIVHNCTQAVALDLQAETLVRLEQRSYPVVMHTHDEASAEMRQGVGSIDEMSAIMCERPGWASWWPIRAAGWRHRRYQKD